MRYLYFYGAWRNPCKTQSPIMNEVSSTIPVEKIDVDTNYEMASNYGIRSVPTILLMNGNSEVRRFVGIQTKETLIQAAQ